MTIDEKIIKNTIEKNYKIVIEKIEKNEESTDGNVYMVNSNEKKYVIKIYSNINHANSMAKLHDFLSLHKVKVPKIIKNLENKPYCKENGFYIVVYSFMDGKHITWDNGKGRLKEKTIRYVAKALRNLHDTTENNNTFELPKLTFGSKLGRNSVLHFDLTKHNIFIDDDTENKVGFIDFDDAKYGPSVCDVAIIISILFFSKTNGANLEDTHKFINEYYSDDIELRNREIPFIKEFSLKWLEYLLNENEFDTSTKESFEARKELISKYLIL